MVKISKTDDEWKLLLTEEEFQITRKSKTELAFSGKLLNNKEIGIYNCICCNEELFDSSVKYDSGCGWPSFFKPSKTNNVGSKKDHSFFMERTEVHCKKCDAHLGHVFEDGPRDKGGLRYCINSVALNFKKK